MCSRFVMLTSPRTGSNWLCSLLNAHPKVLCHFELFNSEGIFWSPKVAEYGVKGLLPTADERCVPDAFLDKVWALGKAWTIQGFKLFHIHDCAVQHSVIEDEGIKKILLRRRNRLSQFLSLQKAITTGAFDCYSDKKPGPIKITISCSAFMRFFEEIERAETLWKNRLIQTGQAVHVLDYEECLDDIDCAMGSLFEYLHVEQVNGLRSPFKKQNQMPLYASIHNIDAVERMLRGIGEASWLEDS